jgi:hypothetical protein
MCEHSTAHASSPCFFLLFIISPFRIHIIFHLLPLVVPFLEVCGHVFFLSLFGSGPALVGASEGDVGVVEEGQDRVRGTLGRCGGSLRGRSGLGWAMERGCDEYGWVMRLG